ncbi:hypothetical protein AXF42_Ash012742 [Apostasia shenzhenica]|uniref:Rubredoxin-like domain-containing protein n=1 Tax=Apostasia shenzhenica TaxID=1088818 RepID=A0A2I0AM23_9ASPA|nr:hypothetical protein AXF42_Ash012742 [Apostasia shenzhenica]
MALATVRPGFSFHGLPPSPPPKPSKTHPSIIPNRSNIPFPYKAQIHAFCSVDVTKEDKPLSSEDPPATAEIVAEKEKIDRRRLEERFAVLNTGIYECRSCGFRYDEAVGDPSYPIPPGLGFEMMPEDWRCPTCGAAKSFFESKRVEIAGFAQNQSFGFGTNTLTAGQKALLIYGSLLLSFVLFLSGYFLQ